MKAPEEVIAQSVSVDPAPEFSEFHWASDCSHMVGKGVPRCIGEPHLLVSQFFSACLCLQRRGDWRNCRPRQQTLFHPAAALEKLWGAMCSRRLFCSNQMMARWKQCPSQDGRGFSRSRWIREREGRVKSSRPIYDWETGSVCCSIPLKQQIGRASCRERV